MKQLIVFLLAIVLSRTLWAQEYGPHAKITFYTNSEVRAFSGTVIESSPEEIKVLTCWHGTQSFKSPKVMDALIFSEPIDNIQLSATVTLRVVKFDTDKDILLLSGPNEFGLKIKKTEN